MKGDQEDQDRDRDKGEGTEEEAQRREEEYRGRYLPMSGNEEEAPAPRSSGLTTIIIIALIMAVVVSWGMMSFMGVSKNAYRADITRLEMDLVAARSDIGEQGKTIDSIAEDISELGTDYVKPAALDNYVKVTALDTMFEDYETRLALLENSTQEEGSSSSSNTTYDTTRWTFRDYGFTIPISNVSVERGDIDPNKIEEEDLYDIELWIVNDCDTSVTLKDVRLEATLTPENYAVVNEDETYLDSDSPPWTPWEADFITKTREGQEVCRRITFTSDRFDIPLDAYEEKCIDLVLELVYI